MKKLILLLIAMVMCVTAYGDVTPPTGYFHMPMNGALNFVMRHFSDKPDANYFCLNAESPTGTNVNETWVFFVDPTPELGWFHSCYVATFPKFLKKGTNPLDVSVTTVWMQKPPKGTFTPVHLGETSTETDAVPVIKSVAITPAQKTVGERTYAVIISGGYAPAFNHQRYWNACSFIYQTLTRTYGIPKSHIYPIMADGTDPGKDMLCPDGTYKSQPLDLDFDDIADVVGLFDLARFLKRDLRFVVKTVLAANDSRLCTAVVIVEHIAVGCSVVNFDQAVGALIKVVEIIFSR